MKDLLKDLEKAVSPAEAAKILPTVYQAIDKAVKRGVIKKNTGDRRKAGAAKRVASLSKAK
jgi:ribosomal protein S20